MNHSRMHPFRLAATGGAVALALVASLLLGWAGTGQAAGTHESTAASGRAVITARQLALHDSMRKLWEAHVTWTRLAIVTFADGSAGFDATAQRLLRNQDDIGAAFARFYGTKTGDQLAALLHDHITIAVEILQAAKAGDQSGVEEASTRWYANAREIADFISSLDRHVWPRQEMRSMMKTHLDQTLTEATDELTGSYQDSIQEYAAIERHILEMADMLSAGIVQQFPRHFDR
jgi:hypothetical protein